MKFKTLDEIKTAVAAGKHVCWRSTSYSVIQDSKGQTFVQYQGNGHCVFLKDHAPRDFFIRYVCERCEENSVTEPDEICWECVAEVTVQIDRAERKQEADWWAEQEDQYTPNFNGY